MCSMARIWPQCWQVVGCPWNKIWDFVALVWPIRSRVITISSSLVRCWNFLESLSSVSQDIAIYHVWTYPIWLEPPAGYRSLLVVSNLHSEQLSAGLCHGQVYLLLLHSFITLNAWALSRSGHKYLCHSMPRGAIWCQICEHRQMFSVFPIFLPGIVVGCDHSVSENMISIGGIAFNLTISPVPIFYIQCSSKWLGLNSVSGCIKFMEMSSIIKFG